MHSSVDITTRSIAARVLRAYVSAEPEEIYELFDHICMHGDTPTACEGITTIEDTPGQSRLATESTPRFYTTALYDLHDMTVKIWSKVVIGTNSSKATLAEYEKTKPGANYAATAAAHNMAE